MLVMPSSIPPAAAGDGVAVPGTDLAGRVLSGPGLWLDWLGELQRASLPEDLLAEGVIARAQGEAPHRHSYDRTLTGKMTVICVLAWDSYSYDEPQSSLSSCRVGQELL
jgi:hypothetical protein